eukprot:CAMPEP_0172449962 /NCGR_PEP_ID=MMETSP1065-20121228/8523_1 /TAXON_ID=265537 /ORGANISM="Amphiprora paludosa, Strain CCMP125" /LENGTH=69 /DNA_ID=CAMNT_0013201725 /DNA_START=74 /DNA_END=279 /DNA_ORIENTATION=+
MKAWRVVVVVALALLAVGRQTTTLPSLVLLLLLFLFLHWPQQAQLVQEQPLLLHSQPGLFLVSWGLIQV